MGKLLFSFFILFISGSVFADGEINIVLGPDEIPAGEQFTIIVAGNAVTKDQNRMIAIQFPENWKINRAYAAEDGATEITPIDQYPQISSYFSKEKGQSIKVFDDQTKIYSDQYDGIAYFFVFTSPKNTSSGNFKVCFIERSDPSIPEVKENKKGKKQKPQRPRNYEWHIVSPYLGSTFSFAEISGKKFIHSVHFVTGWNNNSRALILNDSIHSQARLIINPSLLRNFFKNPFSIQWWMKAVSGEQLLFKFLQTDSLKGLTISANPFGQIDIRKYPSNSDSDVVLLSSETVCDGGWHHIALSCDSIGTLRLFVDGDVNDSVSNVSDVFKGLSYCSIGSDSIPAHITLDELNLQKQAITDQMEIRNSISVAARDTLSDLLALFHFEEFGRVARSSVAQMLLPKDTLSQPSIIPIYFLLDSGAFLEESSSPVLLDKSVLTVEQSSPTKVIFNWKATTEIGIKRYDLQRRIATFGEYEKMLSVDAKRQIHPNTIGKPIVERASYSAAEKLPQLSHDIDLYYRLALVGANDSILQYTEPVKLEFGGARDVFVEQNNPNPFNPKTTINFRLTKKTNVQIAVYDIIGREVSILFDGKLSAGKHSIDIDATNWRGGIYFYKVKTSKTIVTKKMVLAK